MNCRPAERVAALIYQQFSASSFVKGEYRLTIIFMLTSRLTLSMNTSLHAVNFRAAIGVRVLTTHQGT